MQVFATSPVAVYSGVGNAFTRISSTEGMRALWRGVTSVVLGAGPAHAVHFGTLEAVKELVGGNRAGNNWVATCQYMLHRLLANIQSSTNSSCRCIGHYRQRCPDESFRWYGWLVVCFCIPDSSTVSVVKQRMQVHKSEFRSVITCARTLLRNEGIGAFYVSYPTTLAISIPFNAIQFTVYE